MGKWIEESDYKASCVQCHTEIARGTRFYWKRKGVYLCELCGSLAEHEEPEVGRNEQGVLNDLAMMPDEAAESTEAQMTLYMARSIDRSEVAPRDIAPLNLQMRQNLDALRARFPETGEEDITNVSRSARDKFLESTFEDNK
jgi:hypothetical protein